MAIKVSRLSGKEQEEFATLWRMRPFEMTPEQKERWAYFSSEVDTQKYGSTLTYRRVGEVKSISVRGYEIEWENGLREQVSLRNAPTLIGYIVGQAFEAQSTYRGKNLCTLLRLTKIKQCKPISSMTNDELFGFWKSLPTTAKK
ncbi:MAG: hypothetical protein AABW80_03985 [Nanoarchaeota archaeon]